MIGQRTWLSSDVQGFDGLVDGPVGVIRVGEGLMGEVMGFEVAPHCFDVIEFGRISGQPPDAEPMGAGGGRGPGRLAGMVGPLPCTMTTGFRG